MMPSPNSLNITTSNAADGTQIPASDTDRNPKRPQHRRLYRSLLMMGATLCLAVTPLSGCSLFTPPLERDESVHAVFDSELDIVKMPLSEYIYFETNNYANTAFQIAMKKCMAEHGQSYTIKPAYPEGFMRGDKGRKYGAWNVEYHQKYGYEKPDPNAEAPISVTAGASLSPDEQERIDCYPKARDELDAAVPEGKREDKDTTQPTYIRLENEAGNAVYGSALHKELEEKWKQCVSNRGLTPNRAGSVAEETPLAQAKYERGWDAPPTEEEIRLITIQAECNREVGMTQQLYDLEAQYQMPLIRKHQAQLDQERQAAKDFDEKYRQYVTDNQ